MSAQRIKRFLRRPILIVISLGLYLIVFQCERLLFRLQHQNKISKCKMLDNARYIFIEQNLLTYW